MSHWVYISPHLDDAVLSCGGSIYQNLSKGDSVTVVSVFTKPGKDCDIEIKRKYKRRLTGDLLAGNMLGFNTIDMGYTDAPFRESFFNSYYSIMFSRINENRDGELIIKVSKELESIIMSETKPEKVVFPLGVGGHIDHQIVHRASKAINKLTDISYYEDRPYSFIPGSVAHHWIGACDSGEYKYVKAKFSTSKGIITDDYLPFLSNYMADEKDRALSFRELNDRFHKVKTGLLYNEIWKMKRGYWKKRYVFLEDSDVSALIRAIASYDTEINALFGLPGTIPYKDKMDKIRDIYEYNIFKNANRIWHEVMWEYCDYRTIEKRGKKYGISRRP